jgi:hypothetical protein
MIGVKRQNKTNKCNDIIKEDALNSVGITGSNFILAPPLTWLCILRNRIYIDGGQGSLRAII